MHCLYSQFILSSGENIYIQISLRILSPSVHRRHARTGRVDKSQQFQSASNYDLRFIFHGWRVIFLTCHCTGCEVMAPLCIVMYISIFVHTYATFNLHCECKEALYDFLLWKKVSFEFETFEDIFGPPGTD